MLLFLLYSKYDMADMLSVSSTTTQDLEEVINTKPEIFDKKSFNLKYKSFVQTFLKVKFEKIHNSNLAQIIGPEDVYKEVVRQNIKQSDWREFILSEFKHPNLYLDKSKSEQEIKTRSSNLNR